MKCELRYSLVGWQGGTHPLAEKIAHDLHRLQQDLTAGERHENSNATT